MPLGFADLLLPVSSWECPNNATVGPAPIPASSNPACGFPALGFPVCFLSRLCGCFKLEVLSLLTSRAALGIHGIARVFRRPICYSTVSSRILCVAGHASSVAESSSPPSLRSSKSTGSSVPLQSSSPICRAIWVDPKQFAFGLFPARLAARYAGMDCPPKGHRDDEDESYSVFPLACWLSGQCSEFC